MCSEEIPQPFNKHDCGRAFIRLATLSIRQLIEKKSRLLLFREKTIDITEMIGQLQRQRLISSSLEKALYESLSRCNRQIHSTDDVEDLELAYQHVAADLYSVLQLWKI
jgi:hypothetical protein